MFTGIIETLGTISNGFGSLAAEATYETPWAVADTLLPYLGVALP